MLGKIGVLRTFVVALLLGATPVFAADGGTWSVSKVSGEVWITSESAQPASLKQEDSLAPGATIRTGRNGRVLLVRGEESMLISPNSDVGLPQRPQEGLATTIIQRAGSILLDVEKRNVKHFEVETPFLAAVVKGTQFSVTVGAKSTSVDVKRGQVQVADFKTGQIAQVMPGQGATVFSHGKPGLVLSGSGTFNPIEQGKPRTPSVQRVPVPGGGLAAPQRAQNGAGTKQLGNAAQVKPVVGRSISLSPSGGKSGISTTGRHGGLRLSSSIGEMKLNFSKVTHGLAHGSVVPVAAGRSASASQDNTSIWNSGQGGSSTSASSNTSQSGSGGAAGSGNGSSGGGSGPGAAAAVGAAIISAGAVGPDGNGPPGPGKKAAGAANVAGGNGPHGKGPAGNGPPGHGGGGPPGNGPGGNGPPGHNK
jgi:hypothetical protein